MYRENDKNRRNKDLGRRGAKRPVGGRPGSGKSAGRYSSKNKVSDTAFSVGTLMTLKVERFTDFGAYLSCPDENTNRESSYYKKDKKEDEVLLPKKYFPEGLKVGDSIEVFIYRDSSDRIVATTEKPLIMKDKVAPLTVKEVGQIGAFMDWGLEKDLLLPFREMEGRVKTGETVLVRMYVDKSGRPACSMRDIWKYLSTNPPYQKGDLVTGRVYELGHDFGTFVAVDDKYAGMIPRHEKTRELRIGQVLSLHVTGVKEDGKLDLSLREDAYKEMENDGEILLKLLESYAGVLPFTEKASPEVILRETGLSKNAFKRAVGHLYKERKISLEDGKIRLVDNN